MSSDYRRRPGEKGEYKKELRASRLGHSRDPCHDGCGARQRSRRSWLYDQVRDVAKRAVGLNGLTVRVYVPGLHEAAEGDQCAAEKAEHHP